MVDKIITFGDSFLFGSDLSDIVGKPEVQGNHSSLTWPSLVAKELNLDYECWAQPGRGNHLIALKIFQHSDKNSLSIINWSWIDRFDHHFKWYGWPTTIRPNNNDKLSEFYYKHIHTEFDDRFRNLITIHSTLAYLKNNNFPFIMTYMDQLITNDVKGVEHLVREIRDSLQTFPNGQTFLEWSRANGYPESDNWHPLEQAHEEAAKYWLPIYQQAINTHTATIKD